VIARPPGSGLRYPVALWGEDPVKLVMGMLGAFLAFLVVAQLIVRDGAGPQQFSATLDGEVQEPVEGVRRQAFGRRDHLAVAILRVAHPLTVLLPRPALCRIMSLGKVVARMSCETLTVTGKTINWNPRRRETP